MSSESAVKQILTEKLQPEHLVSKDLPKISKVIMLIVYFFLRKLLIYLTAAEPNSTSLLFLSSSTENHYWIDIGEFISLYIEISGSICRLFSGW